MKMTEYFEIEASTNYDKFKDKPFLKTLTWMNYYNISVIIFIIDIGLHIYMLAVNNEKNQRFTESCIHYTLSYLKEELPR